MIRKIFQKINFKQLYKLFVVLLIFVEINQLKLNLEAHKLELNKEILKLQNLSYFNIEKKIKMNNNIRIGISVNKINVGGMQRETTLFLNYLKYSGIFELYLISLNIEEKEAFFVSEKIKRIFLKDENIYTLIRQIKKKKIDILIYQFPREFEIRILNKITNFKTIFYLHSSIFYWINWSFIFIKTIYKEYINSKYIVSIIPIENDFIFKKWGIKSIYMDNFISYEYKSIKPSDLSSKNIIMLGRASNKFKRFYLGIQAMEYITKEIPNCKMKVISDLNNTEFLQNTIINLKLNNYIEFVEFTTKPEIYFKNISLHIFPTISEAFPLALCETKIYGIPNILLGLNYVSMSKGGTIIIYDELTETIAKEAIKVLNNDIYRKILGKEARLSMIKYNNKLLLKKWIKLIVSIYYGDFYYQKLLDEKKPISKRYALNMLETQLNLIKKRKPQYHNITVSDFLNYTFLQNINL